MKKVIVRAPVRADLAGGTLDLWPLYLFHPGSRTVNVAISFYAESEVLETGDGAIEIHLTDQQYRHRYESMHDLAADPKAALIHRAVEHFRLNGIRIITRTDAPRGSGLGGSSALTITLVRALSEIAGRPVEGEELIFTVRDLETRLLGVPAGIQDYYPPVFGGLASLHLGPGTPERKELSLPVAELAKHMLLHYSGVSHFSGTNNWELYKRQIDKDPRVQGGLARIAEDAIEMEKALESGDLPGAGAALSKEWENRKALIDGISTPEIDAAIAAALGAGAWGGKVCGAGGGGCIVFLFPPDRREAIVRALAAVPGRVLDVAPVQHGMFVDAGDADTAPVSFSRGRLVARTEGASLEQLYVYGGTGDYRPYLLAEGVITHSEGRSGTHQTIVRSYVAPMDANDGRVMWHQASQINPETLDIRAVPEPKHRMDTVASPEALTQGASQSEDGFKQFIEESERLQIFHNPAFAVYSEPNETRDAFLKRCLEEANRQLESERERLEGTFRRRIDQLKQKSDREQREIDSKEDSGYDEPPQDVNLAWGQTLYNITSGKPAATNDSPHSVRENDYRSRIAQIQKSWDKELDGLRDDLTAKARAIEDITIVPTPNNIEVTKYLILWAPRLP
ncbi:MAG: putative kinase, galactokinase and mevalonate kinase like protein [Acidobacteria bacterium]|nr:putative kinase, galactokinase and mevalonate kinase like protein [Acidobacteriota bacterium]